MRAALSLLVLALAAGVAHGEPPVDAKTQASANALFQQGQTHYQTGDYAAAIDQFKAAYDLVHDPVYLFNIAQSYRKTFDCVAAADYYRKYLAAAPAAPNKAKVDDWLRELQPCVDQRTAEAARAAHDQAARDQAARAAAEHAAKPAPPPPRMVIVDDGRTYRIAGLAAGGVGAVGLAIGIGFAAHGSSLASSVQGACGNGCSWDQHAGDDSAGHRANTLSAIGFIGGGLAAIAGVGLYYYGHSRAAIEVTPTSVAARVAF